MGIGEAEPGDRSGGPNGFSISQIGSLLSLSGRGFVILGAGQGMGEMAVATLTQLGARIICVDVKPEEAARVADAWGGHPIVADVTSSKELESVFRKADELFGSDFVGIVDVVGMVHVKDVTEMEHEDWRRQFDMVFTHASQVIRFGAPRLARNGGGTMVFLGSIAGVGVRTGGMLPYSVAKAALNQLVRGAAKQWARERVRMNVVAPGLTRTQRLDAVFDEAFWEAQNKEIPMAKPAQVADVVSAILFYASDLSKHVTGTVLPVDGGAHLLGESTYMPKPRSLP
jgi:3alpha(or 20beta)-hydroxysteroid dehydrogenase